MTPITYVEQVPNKRRHDARINHTAIIAEMLAGGKPLRDIAIATGLSVPTVSNYRIRINREARMTAEYGASGRIEDFGVNTRQRILSFVSEYTDMHGARPTQRAIAMALGVSQSYVSSVCREPRL